jgi:hypothetical protein
MVLKALTDYAKEDPSDVPPSTHGLLARGREAAKLASINLTLMSKLAVFDEISNGKVVSIAHPELRPR